ncbi:MAG: hypothetical protein JWP12_2654, partial [Bacteroidetes bacterium]|nr:hypothetical protein [Bacteroidota bacterium]
PGICQLKTVWALRVFNRSRVRPGMTVLFVNIVKTTTFSYNIAKRNNCIDKSQNDLLICANSIFDFFICEPVALIVCWYGGLSLMFSFVPYVVKFWVSPHTDWYIGENWYLVDTII